jgi:valyl-tRNA synthetase
MNMICEQKHKMNKTYDPQQIEESTYETWEKTGEFTPSGSGAAYCIMLPPPNVTGNLHMGHGFQNAIMDILIRYHRMCGDNTLWQAGVDHAGIATQMVVENQLAREGKTRHDLSRDELMNRALTWKAESGGNITRQMRRLGSSPDWTREEFTLNENYIDAVKKVFVQLYDENLIYRGKRLVNWDPHFKTAISNLEVIQQEEDGFLWHIRYPISGNKGELIVATTRPETMLGDSAVAVNPKDERYKNLVGEMIELPLSDRKIPIIADNYVEQEFGTGCVKITPAHDFNDYEVGKRHDLPIINILTEDAHINEQAPETYRGLERFAARKQILNDLEAQGLLVKTEKHKLKVPRNDRGNTILEPYLTDQWYVKTKPLAEPAMGAVKQGKTSFVPENWSKIYFQWLENIEDWCISRQLWWGHRIPAWYDEDNNIYVAEDEAEVREKYQLGASVKLKQDNDVLDTWFSSALWPFATLGWPQNTAELKTFYPTSVLVTGFDIIFFWVARMMMMGLKFTGEVPFKQIYITGLIRDAQGQKMSKSKGNVLDPIDLIDGIDLESLVKKRTQNLMQNSMREKVEKATRKEFPGGIAAYGTDALRFTYCALATNGRDIRFDVGRLSGYRNFCNKIWNATRYVLMQVENAPDAVKPVDITNSVNRWIIARLQAVSQQAKHYFDSYRFDLLAQLLYDFVWAEFCDWYIELSKVNLQDESLRAETLYTLFTLLDNIVRLLHPIMPFITESIYQSISEYIDNSGSIMAKPYPEYDEKLFDEKAIADTKWLQAVITAIRNIRGEMNISPSKKLAAIFNKGDANDKKLSESLKSYLVNIAKLTEITWLDGQAPASATALTGDLEILIPMSDLIDKDEEIQRLNKEIAKHEKDLAKIQGKLANKSFIDKAPEAVVAEEKDRLATCEQTLAKLKLQLDKINNM